MEKNWAFERKGQRKWSKTSYRTGRKKSDTDGERRRKRDESEGRGKKKDGY